MNDKAPLNLEDPIPFHSWQEFHRAEESLRWISREIEITKRERTDEEWQLALRARKWVDDHKVTLNNQSSVVCPE